jgi:hypothetical protein
MRHLPMLASGALFVAGIILLGCPQDDNAVGIAGVEDAPVLRNQRRAGLTPA